MSAPFSPVEFLAAGCRQFADAVRGGEPAVDYRRIVLDPAVGQAISDAYMDAPAFDRSALAAYRAFAAETVAQFHFLESLAVTVDVVGYDPYPDAVTMAADLRQHRLKVFATGASGNPHPFLSARVNDMFRAVHDAFGHAASGRGFDDGGEEAAWLKQSFMYSPLARRALATETRGQNCARIFHYRSERFAEQKLALLPERFSDVTGYHRAIAG